jgi:hypothetical protein
MTAAGLLEELFLGALRGGLDAGRGPIRGGSGMSPETTLAFGALVQTYRDAGLAEQKRFSELWRSFKALDRKVRRLARGVNPGTVFPS